MRVVLVTVGLIVAYIATLEVLSVFAGLSNLTDALIAYYLFVVPSVTLAFPIVSGTVLIRSKTVTNCASAILSSVTALVVTYPVMAILLWRGGDSLRFTNFQENAGETIVLVVIVWVLYTCAVGFAWVFRVIPSPTTLTNKQAAQAHQ